MVTREFEKMRLITINREVWENVCNDYMYLKSRMRAISEHAYKTKKNEAYLVIQGKDGKFRKVQIPDLKP